MLRLNMASQSEESYAVKTANEVCVDELGYLISM